jgi:hypothetical protein
MNETTTAMEDGCLRLPADAVNYYRWCLGAMTASDESGTEKWITSASGRASLLH